MGHHPLPPNQSNITVLRLPTTFPRILSRTRFSPSNTSNKICNKFLFKSPKMLLLKIMALERMFVRALAVYSVRNAPKQQLLSNNNRIWISLSCLGPTFKDTKMIPLLWTTTRYCTRRGILKIREWLANTFRLVLALLLTKWVRLAERQDRQWVTTLLTNRIYCCRIILRAVAEEAQEGKIWPVNFTLRLGEVAQIIPIRWFMLAFRGHRTLIRWCMHRSNLLLRQPPRARCHTMAEARQLGLTSQSSRTTSCFSRMKTKIRKRTSKEWQLSR